MSRSRKKVAGYVDRNPYMKRYSNKSIRRTTHNRLRSCTDFEQYDDGVSSFSGYKRGSVNPYDICDYRFLYYSDAELMTSCIRFLKGSGFGVVSLYTFNINCYYRDFITKEALRKYHKAWSK